MDDRASSGCARAIGTEVVGEIDFWEQVAVEVGRADCQRPTLSTLLVKCAVDFLELHGGCRLQALSIEGDALPAVLGERHRVLHLVADFGACVKDACSISEEVADD